MNKILHGDSLDVLKTFESDSVDVVVTDPPYGYSFMGKAWDKALPDVGIFKETLRVLKPGAFAFVMSAPRSDVCSRMSLLLEEAGFNIAFTPIYWTYASGFPKAMNIGKMVDKRNGRHQPTDEFKQYLKDAKKLSGLTCEQIDHALGFFNSGVFSQHYVGNTHQVEYPTVEKYRELKKVLQLDNRYDELIEREEAEREVLGKHPNPAGSKGNTFPLGQDTNITAPATDAAKALDGSYGGFQPKPAVEVIIVAMKPLSEKTYVDQALNNGKGITWLDDCRIPYKSDADFENAKGGDVGSDKCNIFSANGKPQSEKITPAGRFPANLICSDDVLNDGRISKSGSEFKVSSGGKNRNVSESLAKGGGMNVEGKENTGVRAFGDEGGYSRFFSLDAWYKKRMCFICRDRSDAGHTDLPCLRENNLDNHDAILDTSTDTTGDNRVFAAQNSEQVKGLSTLPFLAVPKASKSEKNAGLEGFGVKPTSGRRGGSDFKAGGSNKGATSQPNANHHPTVKPLKLMSYLITLGSRPGDVVLDPFCGSGTTCIAAKELGRNFIGVEREVEYVEIAEARLAAVQPTLLTQPTVEQMKEAASNLGREITQPIVENKAT